jgi:hypothetical protein
LSLVLLSNSDLEQLSKSKNTATKIFFIEIKVVTKI